MISAHDYRELVKTYERFGWILRRLLLSDAGRDALSGPLSSLEDAVTVTGAPVDAAWFARPTSGGITAWELRSLAGSQYAILEHLDEKSPDFEDRLAQIEARLAASSRPDSAA